jgi:membrane-associated protease RseP (regulator of RpoE activity)
MWHPSNPRLRTGVLAVLLPVVLAACGAVYPEVATPVRPYPTDRELTPPPPADLLYVEFQSATIPPKTRDGRQWDRVGGAAPDVFAQLFVDDREILRTPVASNTIEPTWPGQKKANYRIPHRSRVRVELWDSNPLNNRPVCVQRVRELHASAQSGELLVSCDSGARVRLRVAPARARLGLGFSYELRSQSIAVTRVIGESPAARAGLRKGDRLVEIEGRPVAKMEEGEAQSLINSRASVGLKLLVRNADGERPVELKAGPIYPTVDEPVSVD